jgi:sugar phosphate isomerase/epimerase
MSVPLAVQLYTLRDESAGGIEPVLERVASIGYAGVETAGLQGLSGEQFRAVLDRVGLRAASAHIGYEGRDAFKAALEAHAPLGVDTVIVPFAAPREFETADGISKLAERLNRANAIAQACGVALGYHNHYWELQHSYDGRSALVALFDQLDPNVVAEVDIYWASVGGTDPAVLLNQLAPRVTRLHVKDGPGGAPDLPMTAVGDGVIEVDKVLGTASNAAWHIVELDACATDMFTAVERSFHYLVDGGLSQGRS